MKLELDVLQDPDKGYFTRVKVTLSDDELDQLRNGGSLSEEKFMPGADFANTGETERFKVVLRSDTWDGNEETL